MRMAKKSGFPWGHLIYTKRSEAFLGLKSARVQRIKLEIANTFCICIAFGDRNPGSG